MLRMSYAVKYGISQCPRWSKKQTCRQKYARHVKSRLRGAKSGRKIGKMCASVRIAADARDERICDASWAGFYAALDCAQVTADCSPFKNWSVHLSQQYCAP
jgi:hypothetical protein